MRLIKHIIVAITINRTCQSNAKFILVLCVGLLRNAKAVADPGFSERWVAGGGGGGRGV